MLSRKGIPQGEWRLHPESVQMIWTRYGAAEVNLFATSSKCTLPAVLLPVSLPAEGGRTDITLASSQAVYIYVKQKKITTKRCFGDTHRPELAKPALVPGPDRAAGGIALADPCQEGSAISDERLGVAPEPGVVEPSCVVASGISEELSALHSHVLDMLSEARTPSTRHLYALKWGVFVK